jgi:hypothetical protein
MKMLLTEKNESDFARHEFFKEFEEIFGQSFEEWRKSAINTSIYPNTIHLEDGKICAFITSSSQIWQVYLKDTKSAFGDLIPVYPMSSINDKIIA